MKQCKNACNTNPDCKAFHYYLLDPRGYTNCWLWTQEGYAGNGSEKAFCFIKTHDAQNAEGDDEKEDKEQTLDEKEETTEVDLEQIEEEAEEGNRRQTPKESMRDWDNKWEERKQTQKEERDRKKAQREADKKKKREANKVCHIYEET